MNIVITAGGTSEYIDKVRKITNSSSGLLGSKIANNVSLLSGVENIYYICTPKVIKPKVSEIIKNGINIQIIEATTTNEVKNAVENVLLNHKIDWFIHSMAISDYCVDYVTTIGNIVLDLEKNESDIDIREYLEHPMSVLDNSSKLSSSEDNLIIKLKQTPKIIGEIKKLSPTTKLVGFKLLENVSLEKLTNVAMNLCEKNDCEFVVANDLRDIKNGEHKALIVSKDDILVKEIVGKDNIASTITGMIKNSL